VETHEFTEMYHEYMEITEKEGNGQAQWSFDVANYV
jgi:rubrerythrin